MRRRIERAAWAAVLAVTTTGCSALTRAGEGIGQIGEVVEANSRVITEVVSTIGARVGDLERGMAQLDADADGAVSLEELLAGLGVLAGGLVARNKMSDARKTKTEQRLATLEGRSGGASPAS